VKSLTHSQWQTTQPDNYTPMAFLDPLSATTIIACTPPEVEKAKAEGNAAFAAGQYAKVDHYSRAIKLAPRSAVLYGNRALA